VNDLPTLDPILDLTIDEDAGLQTINLTGISSGAPNENQSLVLSAISSNPGLIANPSVNYTSPGATGTLVFSPQTNANGSAIITVTVNDGGASNNLARRSFTVTVNAVNDPPTIGPIPNQTVNEDSGPAGPIGFAIGD